MSNDSDSFLGADPQPSGSPPEPPSSPEPSETRRARFSRKAFFLGVALTIGGVPAWISIALVAASGMGPSQPGPLIGAVILIGLGMASAGVASLIVSIVCGLRAKERHGHALRWVNFSGLYLGAVAFLLIYGEAVLIVPILGLPVWAMVHLVLRWEAKRNQAQSRGSGTTARLGDSVEIMPRPAVRAKRRYWIGFTVASLAIAATGLYLAREYLETSDAPRTAPGPEATRAPGQTFRDCDGCPEMVVIAPGSFLMGSPDSEPGRDDSEGPQHEVRIDYALAVGKFEVTRGQYARFQKADRPCVPSSVPHSSGSGTEPSDPKNPATRTASHPAACVSREFARAYAEWLSRKTGRAYRLLSEAEWEYAARAGTTTAYSWGDRITKQQANYAAVAEIARLMSRVGSYAPNAFGLHDMNGNAWEWTEDCWHGNYTGAPTDGGAWTSGECSLHVLRGGHVDSRAQQVRSASRDKWRGTGNSAAYITGFRVARSL